MHDDDDHDDHHRGRDNVDDAVDHDDQESRAQLHSRERQLVNPWQLRSLVALDVTRQLGPYLPRQLRSLEPRPQRLEPRRRPRERPRQVTPHGSDSGRKGRGQTPPFSRGTLLA